MRKISKVHILTILLFISFALYSETTFADLQKKLHNIAESATDSVVFISTEKVMKQQFNNPQFDPFEFFFNNPQDKAPKQREYKQTAFGSGVIFHKKDGKYYIMTNNHVIDDADTIKITIDHKTFYDGKVLGADPETDVAVVEIETKDKLTIAETGDSSNLKVADFVIAIGNPFGLSHSMTFGIISALGRSDIAMDSAGFTSFIQTDAAINPGNSGGPLLNIEGEVIGINTMIYSRTGGNIGIGFAIPINVAMKIADQLLTTGKIEHGWLGVGFEVLDDEKLQLLDIPKKYNTGILVREVYDESPADKAGLKTGDILLELNDKKLVKGSDLTIVIGSSLPGTQIKLKVLRDKREITVNVTLGSRSEFNAETNIPDESDYETLQNYGIEVTNGDSLILKKYKLPDNVHGVVITRVTPGSIAERSGFAEGDLIYRINSEDIQTVKDLTTILAEIEDRAYFFTYRGSKSIIRIM